VKRRSKGMMGIFPGRSVHRNVEFLLRRARLLPGNPDQYSFRPVRTKARLGCRRTAGRGRERTNRNRQGCDLPLTDLQRQRGSQTTAILDLLTWPTRFWSLGSQLAETLFDVGKHRAQVKLTQAAYDATVANYRQTVLTAFQQVEDSLAQLRILSQEAEIVDRAVKAAQQSLEISTTQYREGIANYLL